MMSSGNLSMRSGLSGALFVLLLLAACTLAETVILYNNTGTGVVVEACGKRKRLGNGLTLDVRDPCQEIPDLVRVHSPGPTWQYVLPDVPTLRRDEFLPFHGGANIRLRVQLQPNGQMLAVPENAQFPSTPDTQPPGFPLSPTGSTG
jgi:hypothetical protein